MTRTNNLLLAVCSLALLAGCSRMEGSASAQTATPSAAPAKKVTSGKVARIGFIDLERCCACTRTRIDAAWKALTEVLGARPTIPVQRVHLDTQADRAAPYRAKKELMFPPAIYFLDRKEGLVEMLQGEVTAAQIRKVLK
jgi:hypothetical protein